MTLTCHYDDIIPKKFHKYSGFSGYKFRVSSRQQYQQNNCENGWFCDLLLQQNKWQPVYLPSEHFPDQIEALKILANLSGETERQIRYINIHTAYELVVQDRDVEYSSIRHALVHPTTKLTRPNVKASLLKRFGSLNINLRDYYHQKEYYRCICEMLIAIEKIIFNHILSNISDAKMVDL